MIGFLAAGMPIGVHLRGWLLAGRITSFGFTLVSLTALRFDLTMVPLVLGTMIAVGAIARGAQRAFPGALVGSWAGAIIVASGRLVAVQVAADDPREPGRGRTGPAGPGVRISIFEFLG